MEKFKLEFLQMAHSLFSSRRGIIWLINKITALAMIAIALKTRGDFAAIALLAVSMVYDGTYAGYLTWEKINTNFTVGLGK